VPVSMAQTEQGFLGWYIVRSFALYASTLSNHRSRHAFVSVLAFALLAVDAAIIIDAFRSLLLRSASVTFTTAHGFAVVAVFGWGPVLLFFFVVARGVGSEIRKHLYLADVAAMFHMFRDADGASVIARCRGMIAEHDYTSRVLGLRVNDRLIAGAAVYHGLAMSAMVLLVVMWSLQLTGARSEILLAAA
jgi:hypothetical protein